MTDIKTAWYMGKQKGTEGNRIQRPSEETQGTSESCRKTRVREQRWRTTGNRGNAITAR